MSQIKNPKEEEEDTIEIREVWNHNLYKEMDLIEQAIDDFPFVAMDTEFPGTVCKTVKATNPNPKRFEYYNNYETLKTNVNMLKMIQLGLTLSDEQGNLPIYNKKQCIWQFNFREFNLNYDMYAMDSIQILKDSNIDFDKNNKYGVDSTKFAELLMGSGVVLNPKIQWVTFHCQYDFGYLIKLLSGKALPEEKSEFFKQVKVYFPVMYDIKHLMGFCSSLYGGLEKVAELVGVKRVGVSHQAGSDSLLTLRVFNKMKEMYFKGDSLERYCGVLFGFDNNNPLDKNH